MPRKANVVVSMFVCSMIPVLANAQVYKITDLGQLSPTAINSWAQIVGNYNGQAYVWTFGEKRGLGTLPGGTFSWAAAINDLGVITGTADGQGIVRPNSLFGYTGPNVECDDLIQPFVFFVWKQQMQGLGTLGPSSDVAAQGPPSSWCIYPFYGAAINDHSEVVGYTGFLPDAYQWGLSWTATGGMGLFGSSFTNTFANGISNSGQIVGQNGFAGFPADDGAPTYWKDGVATLLEGLSGSYYGGTNAVNDMGQVVGWSQGSYGTHAVLWTQSGTVHDLGTLGGDTDSAATKINLFGLVIGTSGNTISFPTPIGDHTPNDDTGPLQVVGRPFIWNQHRGMQDLNTLIRTNSGWVLTTATDINVWGQIVGNGTLNGEPHGFLLTPRDPFQTP